MMLLLVIVLCGMVGTGFGLMGYGYNTPEYWLIVIPICIVIGFTFGHA